MRSFCLISLFLLGLAAMVRSQSPYEFYYNNALAEDDARPPSVDDDLFLRHFESGENVFERLAEFNFSFTRWSRRGYEKWMSEDSWGGVRLNGLVSYFADYQLFSVLRQGKNDGGYTADARSLIREGGRVQALAFNRRGQGGVRFSYGGEIPRRDAYAGVSFSHRAGRDPRIGGVFMDETSALGAIDLGNFSFAMAALRSSNGLRGYATNESFRLTSDKYYNPSWGWWGDKQRSSRTNKEQSINSLATWKHNADGVKHTVSAALRLSRESRGGLAWFDAAAPYPDYYRYMPDYESVNSPDGWLLGDERVTQIFWEQLVEQNRNRPEQVAYIVENRVEDMTDFCLSAQGEARLGDGWNAMYSIDFQQDTRMRYKQLYDLLGATPFPDEDWHLHSDEIFGTRDLNDIKNPERLVGEGDRFGYAYKFVATAAEGRAAVNYRAGGFHISGDLHVGTTRIQRHGKYEKELFPGKLSFGKSRSYVFNPWTFDLSGGWAFSARHYMDFAARVAELAPYADNIFVNPDYSNIAIEHPESIKMSSAELHYKALWERVGVSLSAFWTTTRDESAVYRYWDDIASTYVDMSVNQIVKLFYGVELGAEWEMSPRFKFSCGAALGSYTYGADTQVVITDDATREIVASGVRARMKGFHLATAPAHTATAEINYNKMGWIASLSASYAGERYVAAAPLRRMQRAYGLAGSPERHSEFVVQEKLPNIFTLNLFILRSLDLMKGRFTMTLAVDNLLGASAIYHGYEQMRIARSGAAPAENWKPFPSKYLYNYGRTYYASAIYTF